MQCTVCGKEGESKYCGDCDKVLKELIQKVGEERWSAIDDSSYIYPMIERVIKGELTVNDIINAMEVED